LFLVYFTSLLTLSSSGRIGDTIEQAKSRYGKPYAEMVSGLKKIHLYETAQGNIREVYDRRGICIESDVETKQPRPQRPSRVATTRTPQPIPLEKFSVNYAPRSDPTQSVQPVKQQEPVYQRPPKADPKQVPAQAAQINRTSRAIPIRSMNWTKILLIAGAVIAAGAYAAYILIRKDPESQMQPGNKVEAFCDFIHRKEKNRKPEPPEEDQDKPYYKNHNAA
jgi:hypothetical protein